MGLVEGVAMVGGASLAGGDAIMGGSNKVFIIELQPPYPLTLGRHFQGTLEPQIEVERGVVDWVSQGWEGR